MTLGTGGTQPPGVLRNLQRRELHRRADDCLGQFELADPGVKKNGEAPLWICGYDVRNWTKEKLASKQQVYNFDTVKSADGEALVHHMGIDDIFAIAAGEKVELSVDPKEYAKHLTITTHGSLGPDTDWNAEMEVPQSVVTQYGAQLGIKATRDSCGTEDDGGTVKISGKDFYRILALALHELGVENSFESMHDHSCFGGFTAKQRLESLHEQRVPIQKLVGGAGPIGMGIKRSESSPDEPTGSNIEVQVPRPGWERTSGKLGNVQNGSQRVTQRGYHFENYISGNGESGHAGLIVVKHDSATEKIVQEPFEKGFEYLRAFQEKATFGDIKREEKTRLT